ncbi:Domain of uncharacterised function (DUF1841) [Legionella beliardensis]|uniref:Domain of uncharacterized function (DUF1841) n=1 Tax=Legionella beliardensis TaxID=91822 RepID=A0A378HYE4_9GAMM|nr:DUF1841 family protein [Legionella beliardensis]STX27571.1 Domain of uncharacterised function (DUF1841) [Legionella beliardensis]
MFFGDNVQDTRALFFSSWRKYRLKEALSPLEQQLVEVITAHPEYHALLEQEDFYLKQEYFPELGQTNPFLHLGLHLAIREQVATNRPFGIKKCFQDLLNRYGDPLTVEHKMMDCLAECLWHAQRNQILPDEAAYLTALSHL